jgi:hypothetical protein
MGTEAAAQNLSFDLQARQGGIDQTRGESQAFGESGRRYGTG